MTPERAAHIERICDAALECDVTVRAAFLEKACAGDVALRREVESLLAQEPATAGFMSTPAITLPGSMVADGPSWIGRQLGPYGIHSRLGAGGMGEVYQAHDIKLGREVAIKVLPEAFAHDPDRLSRLQREAKMLAALNHPNIATIHGLEQSDGTSYLVMELVPGETLQLRLARKGRLPIEDALTICRQIAEALESAHEKGIVHRDLKPANVKVTPEGKVKVLDFGLAKAFAADGTSNDPTHSPTLSIAATAQGVILGTAAYMSPEQARGQAVDKRTDMWAFGCVLYELLAGKPAFYGDTVTEILAGVLRGEPDWAALPGATPTTVRTLLRRCLQKDKALRLRDAGDASIELQEALAASTMGRTSSVATDPATGGWWRAAILGLAVLVGAVVTGVAGWSLRQTPLPAPRPVSRFTIALPPGQQLGVEGGLALALSPDGTRLAFVANEGGTQRLYLRAMGALDASPVPGTEGAVGPFFSPDGLWLGFFADRSLKKISVNGGSALTLVNAYFPFGASWSSQGTIAFAPLSALSLAVEQVSDGGGVPEPLTRLEKGEFAHAWPEYLPGGKAVLFAVGRPDGSEVDVQPIGTGKRRSLIQRGLQPRYAISGHLVYTQGGSLIAVPFDPDRLAVTGAAVPLVEGVVESPSTGAAQYSISSTGSLIYVQGAETVQPRLVWVDRKGQEQVLPAPARNYLYPRLSPDGQRVAVTIAESAVNIWVDDLARDTLTRLTFQGTLNFMGAWTPDSKRIAFQSNKEGPRNLFWQLADGSGGPERLTTSESNQFPSSWSPDGKRLAFIETANPSTARDIWVLDRTDSKARPFLRTPSDEGAPQFFPGDGGWLAYVSNESGRYETYVRPYPGPGRKWQISTDGGTEPVWNRNGRELFYRSGKKMMVVSITTQPSFVAGKPQRLFEGSYLSTPAIPANYDVSRDGQRFLMVKPSEQAPAAATQINVVLNWFEELKQKVPATLKK